MLSSICILQSTFYTCFVLLRVIYNYPIWHIIDICINIYLIVFYWLLFVFRLFERIITEYVIRNIFIIIINRWYFILWVEFARIFSFLILWKIIILQENESKRGGQWAYSHLFFCNFLLISPNKSEKNLNCNCN